MKGKRKLLVARLITMLEHADCSYQDTIEALVGVLRYVREKGDGYLRDCTVGEVLKRVPMEPWEKPAAPTKKEVHDQ